MGRVDKLKYSVADLDYVFGETSQGDTLLQRADSSDRKFVRSQVQIASATAAATGRVWTAREAFDAFGWDILAKVAEDGAATLVKNWNEPATTLKERREEMGLNPLKLARRAAVTEQIVIAAETPGKVSKIRDLEKIAQVLALDERQLGFLPDAGRDRVLGVRLREMSQEADNSLFDEGAVLDLSEAAWIISRQVALSDMLGYSADFRQRFAPMANYRSPVYRKGYDLARKTREILQLSAHEPILSLRALIEEKLNLPLVQTEMNERFAGATIANGAVRGIVINESGWHQNVWIRRMTLCHELAHLLWDPDERLNKLMVDHYGDDGIELNKSDPVEVRANAFAIAFLAPPEAIRNIVGQESDPTQIVARVMATFGISSTAAKYHVANVTGMNVKDVVHGELPQPTDEWVAQENLTLDYFPVSVTPISRRGKFAWLVAAAYDNKLITADTGASYLRCSVIEFEEKANLILSLGVGVGV